MEFRELDGNDYMLPHEDVRTFLQDCKDAEHAPLIAVSHAALVRARLSIISEMLNGQLRRSARNPFHRNNTVALFLARRDIVTIEGEIEAIDVYTKNRYYDVFSEPPDPYGPDSAS